MKPIYMYIHTLTYTYIHTLTHKHAYTHIHIHICSYFHVFYLSFSRKRQNKGRMFVERLCNVNLLDS